MAAGAGVMGVAVWGRCGAGWGGGSSRRSGACAVRRATVGGSGSEEGWEDMICVHMVMFNQIF